MPLSERFTYTIEDMGDDFGSIRMRRENWSFSVPFAAKTI